jgi:hypothetical protein
MKYRYVLILFSFLLFHPSFTEARQSGNLLFEKTGETKSEWAAKTRADLRKAPIRLNDSLLEQVRNGTVFEFQIQNFDGDVYNITVRRVIEQLQGDWSITGYINGDWRNSFTLSYSNGTVLSGIQNIERHTFYDIKYSQEEMEHFFLKVDPHERDELTCGVDHDLETGDLSREKIPEIEENNGRAVIDVMIVYTPRASSWAELNAGGIQNVINQSMAVAQNTSDNSNLNLEFRLVHSAEVDYTESGSSYTDLYRLTTRPGFTPMGAQYLGYLDEVHVWRDIYQADLVAFFTVADDVGGLGWLITNPSGDSRYGFSLTRVQQAAGTTHVHEMGHNMGMAHSRLQNSNPAGAGGGMFNYSTGWRWTGTDGIGYTSVMTYNEGDQGVHIFSNPSINWSGTPTGSYTEPGAPADNARSARNIKHVIAAYRQLIGQPEVTTQSITNITAGRATGTGEITDIGDTPIMRRGICWSISPNPTIGDNCRQSVLSENPFQITLNNLQGNQTYYARAYATNSGGTGYGENIEFTTRDISDELSVVVADRNRVLATGVQESLVEINVLDSDGSPVPDINVIIEQSGGFSNVRTINEITDNDGIARFAISGQNEQKVTYTVYADDLRLSQNLQIEFLFRDPDVKLGNNYPNPFNNQTIIPFVVPEADRVRIDIYNAAGARVQTILDQDMQVGYFEVPFDASQLSSGVYFYRMTTGGTIRTEKMLLLK